MFNAVNTSELSAPLASKVAKQRRRLLCIGV